MKISVIMVTYHAEKTMRRAISSIISQSYPDKELIIIDGKSTDGTVEIIKEYEPYLAYWISEPDAGVYDAMNKGIMHATGDVIAFLNSDDWYEEEIFGIVNSCFEESDVEVLAGQVNYVLNHHMFQARERACRPEDLKKGNLCCHQGMFAKKAVFDRIGEFDLSYKIAADYDWMLRAYCTGVRFQIVNDLFANFCYDGLSSIQRYRTFLELREIAQKYLKGDDRRITSQSEFENQAQESLELTLMNLVLRNEVNFIQKFFKENAIYYLWGAGHYGRICCQLLWAAEIHVAGFIDNNRQTLECYGYFVSSPKTLKGDEWICICSKDFEKDIREQLLEMGHREERILSFLEIKNKMVEYGREKYMDYVLT